MGRTLAEKRKRKEAKAIDDEPESKPQELAEALISRLLETTAEAGPAIQGTDGDHVLLDLTARGVRCVVTAVGSEEDRGPSLSPRESEIARMVALGYPNKTIAAVLEISPWTVGTHLRRVFAKLGVQSRTAMVALLLRAGSLERRPPLTSLGAAAGPDTRRPSTPASGFVRSAPTARTRCLDSDAGERARESAY
ncbi:MAG: helix-turn-helix transcriptional regulator [Planctomycetes bacterium]|nr:helix-turn-helix transcriptional regulator [Planctomycetota bacterium]